MKLTPFAPVFATRPCFAYHRGLPFPNGVAETCSGNHVKIFLPKCLLLRHIYHHCESAFAPLFPSVTVTRTVALWRTSFRKLVRRVRPLLPQQGRIGRALSSATEEISLSAETFFGTVLFLWRRTRALHRSQDRNSISRAWKRNKGYLAWKYQLFATFLGQRKTVGTSEGMFRQARHSCLEPHQFPPARERLPTPNGRLRIFPPSSGRYRGRSPNGQRRPTSGRHGAQAVQINTEADVISTAILSWRRWGAQPERNRYPVH